VTFVNPNKRRKHKCMDADLVIGMLVRGVWKIMSSFTKIQGA